MLLRKQSLLAYIGQNYGCLRLMASACKTLASKQARPNPEHAYQEPSRTSLSHLCATFDPRKLRSSCLWAAWLQRNCGRLTIATRLPNSAPA